MKKRIRISTEYGIITLDSQRDSYDVYDDLGTCLGELFPDDYDDWDDDYSIKNIIEDCIADGTLDIPMRMEFLDEED